MKDNKIKCNVCLVEKSRSDMRMSSRGRIMHHCKDCKGFYRCKHCNEVKTSDQFKTHSHNTKELVFDDEERMRIAVCYTCDYKLNKARYARYDKRVQSNESIKYLCMSNIQRWKKKTLDMSQVFDLTYEYLEGLWGKQEGKCYYTGETISLKRGRGQWKSPSLDRLNPAIGYIQGNVVWTTRIANTSKNGMTENEFLDFCQRVVDYSCSK